mmetsp:Transcript_58163/g.147763  ORF Transcript_58163/g.147763 Transcript_58163/m.147763 type:complete len:530 (-) Transcript_58163:202-1791(-)
MASSTRSLLLLLATSVAAASISDGGGHHRLPLERVRRQRRPGEVAESLISFRPGPVLLPPPVASNATATVLSSLALPAEPLQLVIAAAASAASEQEVLAVSGSYADIRRQLLNEGDLIYVLRAKVGTPPFPVRLVVDTGSSDLWVAKGSYEADRSSTAKLLPGADALLRYGQGQVSGHEVEDRVCLEPLCVKEQTFITASKIAGLGDAAGAHGLFDGLLGLAYPALSATKGVTFLQEVLDHGPWNHFAFGLSLSASDDSEGSFIIFGDLEEVMAEAPDGSLGSGQSGVALPVLLVNYQARFWLVSGMAAVKLQGGDSLIESPVYAALDSGTSLIAVPGIAYNWVMQSLMGHDSLARCGPALGQVLCPCDSRFQDLMFNFPGKDGKKITITLTSEDLLQPMGEAIFPSGETVAMCRINIQPGPPTMPFWILGDVFLRRVYAVHDVREHQVVLFPRRLGGHSTAAAAEGSDEGAHPNPMQAVSAAAALAAAVLLSAIFAAALRRQGASARCRGGAAEEAVDETMRAEYMRL